MADAMSLSSDLFVPEVAAAAVGVQFVTSLQTMQLFGTGMDAPIKITGFENLSGGGEFIKRPVIGRVANLEARRDKTSESLVDTLKFESRTDMGVLINRRIGPASFTFTGVKLSNLREGQLETEFARQAVRLMMETIQSSVIAAAKGSISAMTSALHTDSVYVGTGTKVNLDLDRLADLVALMGDRADAITAWVFRSAPYYKDLLKNQLGQGVTGIADRVAGGGAPHTLGRAWAVVDDSNLYTADAAYDYWYTLGLGANAIEVEFTRPMEIYPVQMEYRSENVQAILRADYDFAIHIPGFAFDSSTDNPTVANLATSAKWTANYADAREVPMVLGEHNCSTS